MVSRRILYLLLFTLSFSNLCLAQSKAIHLSISGITPGQKISSDEILYHFRNYDTEVIYQSQTTLWLRFKKSGGCYFDDIPMPISRMDFTMENGFLRSFELRSADIGYKGYDQDVYNYIYAQYGIHDVGPYEYFPNQPFEWLGANGVKLSLLKEYLGSSQYIHLKCEGSVKSSSKLQSILEKLNNNAL